MNLDEITIEQYMKIIAINKSSLSDVNKAKEILKIFDPKLSLKKSDADILINSIKEILDTDVKDFIRRFKYDGVEYGFIPNLDNITTAEFIDLSEYLKESIYLDRIAAILYRPVTQSDGELYRIEEYEGSDKYSDIMKKVDHRVVLSAMVFFFDFRQKFVKAFPYLYGDAEEEYDEDGNEGYQEKIKDLSEEKQFNDEFGWYIMLLEAALGDFTKIGKVTESPASSFLHFCNYTQRKNTIERNRIERKML